MKSMVLFLLGLMVPVAAAAATEDARRVQSAEIVERFQETLGQRLKQALTAGGPVAAIAVCQREAPAIAARLSAETGARVGRTALRVRNPANQPDADARAVLERFDQAIRAGVERPPESFEVMRDGQARYLKAIVTQPICLNCHGATVDPQVEQALARHYPDDQARGYAAGDLRGAFFVHWPASRGGD